MSIRRKFGEVVLVRTEDEEFLGRIDMLAAERSDECPQCFLDSNVSVTTTTPCRMAVVPINTEAA